MPDHNKVLVRNSVIILNQEICYLPVLDKLPWDAVQSNYIALGT